MHGRGAADAKGPMAAFLCAAHALTKTSFDNRLIVACVVDEEGNGKGIRHLINKGIRPEYAVFGEPSSSTDIVIGYRGGLRVRISFKTQSFHASSPWMGKSAIEAAFELWTSLRKYNEDAIRKERKFNTISACLTQISGGESHNMSPASCEMAVNIRYPPSVSSDRIIQDIHSAVDSLFDDKIKVTVEIDDHTPAYVAPISNELVKSFRNAIKKVTGTDAKLIRKTGSGDMNLFGKEMRTPVITFGPGDPKLSHTPNEKVSIGEFLKSVEVIKEALLSLPNTDIVSD